MKLINMTLMGLVVTTLAIGCGPGSKKSHNRSGGETSESEDAAPDDNGDTTKKDNEEDKDLGNRDPNDPVAAFWGVVDAWEFAASLQQVTGFGIGTIAVANNADAPSTILTSERGGLALTTTADQLPKTGEAATAKIAYLYCDEGLKQNNRARFLPGYNFPGLASAAERDRLAGLFVSAFLQLSASDEAFGDVQASLSQVMADVIAATANANQADTNARTAACAAIAMSAGFMLR